MTHLHRALLLLVAIGFFFSACQNDVDVADIETSPVDVKIKRFEQELFALDTTNSDISFEDQLSQLATKYPDFMEVFTEIIADPYSIDTSRTDRIRDFVTHPGVQYLYDTTQTAYGDISAIETELGEMLGRYKYYFPNKPVPQIVSFISEYSVGNFTYGDSLLAIGWDFFLSEDYSYDYSLFPAFLQRSMDKENLVGKTTETLISNAVGEVKGNQLLDYMISNGKTLYIKSLLLPESDDEIIMEWTTEQTAWMEDTNNERQLWNEILRRDLLYSTRRSEFDKLIVPSPFGTTWMPRESPGKTANWIGWQIVKAYMQRNPETSVPQLLAIENPQAILDGSNYRPARK
ncbi:MAG: hypothetical protein AAGI23_08090 [Bacteroidota bacterium]